MHRFHSLSILAVALSLASQLPAAEKIDFQRDIRPLLADRCFSCHGRDADHREGGLRLDEFEAAKKGGDSGAKAIFPGQPDNSEVIRRISSSDPDEQMPPPKSKKILTASERELIK